MDGLRVYLSVEVYNRTLCRSSLGICYECTTLGPEEFDGDYLPAALEELSQIVLSDVRIDIANKRRCVVWVKVAGMKKP